MSSKTPKPLELKRMFVLLALSKEPMHAYAIHQQALADSQSSLYFSFTSLGRILAELERSGLVERGRSYRFGQREVPGYMITTTGQRLLKMSMMMLADAGQLLRQRLP